MTPEIPKGWEKCELSECTHQLLPSGLTRENSDSINGIFVSEDNPIYRMDFALLGIIPIRRAKPLEFKVERIEIASGRLCLLISVEGTQLARPTADRMIGKTFREVTE